MPLVVIEYSSDNDDLARIYRILLEREGARVVLRLVEGAGTLRFRVNGAVLGREDYYALLELVASERQRLSK